ncbi:MAG TPA: hypothetical protein VGL33_21000 [Streptosporangiaceae bacterium]|jgi:hypothetical protein
MAAIDQALVSILLNGLTPTGAAGIPGTAIGTPVGTSAMRIRLNSTLSTASAAGTELSTQTSGYTNGTGWSSLGQSTASSSGSAVGVPLTTQSFVSNGSPTAVVSFDLTGSAAQRGFWGPFNAQPVNVGSGNTFQVVGGSGAAAGIQISLT